MNYIIEIAPLVIGFVCGFSVATVGWIVLGFLIAKKTKSGIDDLINK